MRDEDKNEVTETIRYEVRESEEGHAYDGWFDLRPAEQSWGFDSYNYGKWEDIQRYVGGRYRHGEVVVEGVQVTSREQAIEAMAAHGHTDPLKSYGGSWQFREVIDRSVTILNATTNSKIVEHTEVIFHKTTRTKQQWLDQIQYRADQDDLFKRRMAELDAEREAEKAAKLADLSPESQMIVASIVAQGDQLRNGFPLDTKSAVKGRHTAEPKTFLDRVKTFIKF